MTDEHKEQNNVASSLDSIKNEISAQLNEQNKKSLSWNSIVITAVLGLLTFVSLGQMLGSITIFNKLKAGNVQAATGAPQTNSLEALPDMVGGC
jgi:hypothetical protein